MVLRLAMQVTLTSSVFNILDIGFVERYISKHHSLHIDSFNLFKKIFSDGSHQVIFDAPTDFTHQEAEELISEVEKELEKLTVAELALIFEAE
jgi:hypothetical protein